MISIHTNTVIIVIVIIFSILISLGKNTGYFSLFVIYMITKTKLINNSNSHNIISQSAYRLQYWLHHQNINTRVQSNKRFPPQVMAHAIAVIRRIRIIFQRTFRISIRFYLKDIYSSTNSQKYSSTNQSNQKGSNYKFFEISGMNREK